MVRVSRTAIDDSLYSVWQRIAKADSASTADRAMYSLEYYINTGRASTDFLNAFVNTDGRQKNRIAKILQDSGADTDKICRIKKVLEKVKLSVDKQLSM